MAWASERGIGRTRLDQEIHHVWAIEYMVCDCMRYRVVVAGGQSDLLLRAMLVL